MTEEVGLEQRTQCQELDSGDEAITDVPNDDYHELFEYYMDTMSRIIKRHTHLYDYGV